MPCHCGEPKQRSNPYAFVDTSASMDCFASLAMTPRSLAMTKRPRDAFCAPEFCQSRSSTEAIAKIPRENRGERSAERRIQPMSALHRRMFAIRAMPWARRAPCRRGANGALICLRGALAFRRSAAALARILSSGSAPGQASWDAVQAGVTRHPLSQSRVAPPAPVLVPASMMPEAARERVANPRAGAALAPH